MSVHIAVIKALHFIPEFIDGYIDGFCDNSPPGRGSVADEATFSCPQ